MKTKLKLSLITLGMAVIFSTIFLSGCKSTTESENSELTEDVNAVQQDIEDAKNESIEQYEAFKLEAEANIDENIAALNELKANAKAETKEAKAELDKKLADLEQKNQALREKVRNYKDEGNEKWEAFKMEFEKDMETISQSFKEVIK